MIDPQIQDEETAITAELKTRRIALAVVITGLTQWTMAVLAVVVLLAWLVLRDYPQVLIFSAGLAVACAVSWLFRRLAAEGRATLGGVVCLGWFMALTAACPVLWPEIIAAAVMCYLFVIMMAYIIFGVRGFFGAVAISLVLLLADMAYIYNPQVHLFPDLPYALASILGGVNGGVAILILSGFCYQIFTSQESAFADAQRASREVERRAEREQAQHRQLQQTVREYGAVLAAVGHGNLAARVPIDNPATGEEEPLVTLGQRMNQTIASLEAMLAQIRAASNDLTTAAAEILSASTQQAAGASEQSAAISQTAVTVDEVKAISEQAILRSQEVVEASNRTVEVSRTGQRMVHQAIDSMGLIKERVERIAENILALSEQTQQIGRIITTVSEIAGQSNMLALNASIEAARAGEQGKGFAVVAAEVRSLAEQSRQATEQVKAILQQIQSATNATVMATEEGTKVVDQGVSLAARAEGAIQQLAQVIEESARSAAQVMAGGRQQSAGVDQIAQAMQNINQAMMQSSASTRQAEKAARDLHDLAGQLNEMVQRYAG